MSQNFIQAITPDELANGIKTDPDTFYRRTTAPYPMFKGNGTNYPEPIGNTKHIVGGAIAGTATISAASLARGGLVFTGGAGTQTLPTAALLLAALGGGGAGTVHDFFVDNSAGSDTCTLAVSASILIPATIVVTGGGTLTVAGQATGLALFRIVFSSATAAVIFRLG